MGIFFVINSLIYLIPFIWSIAFPFIYGHVLSKLFGLEKNIDHWILFFLHICVSIFAVLLFLAGLFIFRTNAAGYYVMALICFVTSVVIEGLVWQFVLRDRNLNGFVTSLICNVIFVVPYVLCFFYMFKIQTL